MDYAKKATALVGSALLIGALPSAALAQTGPETADTGDIAATAQASSTETSALRHILLDNVQGVFTSNQDASLSNSALSRALYQGSRVLCASQGIEVAEPSETAIGTGAIAVGGKVRSTFTASVAEYCEKAPVSKIMGCTCAGNPADGRASANANVGGFQLSALIIDADPDESVNAIRFTSADGYQLTMPLSYVKQRYSIIVTEVNGEPAESAIGCANQLWLGRTAARSFVRDITAIDFLALDQVPDAPTAADAANQPNIAVTEGAVRP